MNIENNMTWKEHLIMGEKAVFPSVQKKIDSLKHLGRSIPLKIRITLANSLVISKFNYVLPIWGGASNIYILKAQTFLNITSRYCTNIPRKPELPP